MRQRWVVRGRVQGVGFRWWITGRADALGLRGWCRNLADGAVEAEAEGEPGAIADLERLLAEGPPGAEVTSCDRRAPGTDALPAAGFHITR